MNTTQDLEELRRRYETWSSEELLRVAHATGDYRPEAVHIAREILAAREVPLDGTVAQEVITTIENERTTADDAAAVPLDLVLRGICFVFCGIAGIAIAVYQGSKGHSRRASDAWTWVGFGWLARVVLFVLVRSL